MTQKLTPSTALLLTIPPLMWAGNAIVGRMVNHLVPPITLNLLRWLLALAIIAPVSYRVFRRRSELWLHWRQFAVLGLLGIGCYNALQYEALQTSSPINVTLVAASMPVWMLALGAIFFGTKVTLRQAMGAILSIVGVLVVLCRGEWDRLLALHLVPGDLFMILASMSWSLYSWLLVRYTIAPSIRADWAAFLAGQMAFGIVWTSVVTVGEWTLTDAHIVWGWPLAAALIFIAVCPAIIAYRCWGLGVQRAGPNIGAFFSNLTPLFAALMSSAFLREMPHLFHGIAFALIVGGILLSSHR